MIWLSLIYYTFMICFFIFMAKKVINYAGVTKRYYIMQICPNSLEEGNGMSEIE